MGEKLEAFLEWCRVKGITFNGLQIRSAGIDAGNGVFATKSFRSNETVIRLPDDLIITAGKIADVPKYASLLQSADCLLNPFEVLTLFFCLEDENSEVWGPYINMLPKDFDTPAYQGVSIDPRHLPLSIRFYWENQTADLVDCWKKIKSISSEIPHERYIWAWHVVNTRCIFKENKPHTLVDSSDGDTLSVIPFVDMLNHSLDAQCIAMYETYTSEYAVRATCTVQEGDQVFVCYGPHDNARLWMEYGFTMVNNPNTRVKIERGLLLTLLRQVGLKITKEHEDVIAEADIPCHLYNCDDGPGWGISTNVLIALMDRNKLCHWKDALYNDRRQKSVDEDDEDVTTPEEEERQRVVGAVLALLRVGIQSKMEKVPKDLAWMWADQLKVVDNNLKSET